MTDRAMTTESLFSPLAAAGGSSEARIPITFNGQPITVPAGANLAASLLAAGVTRFRNSPVSGDGRAPYCMMGVCFECLLDVDGVPNRQSCLVAVRPGMTVRTQEELPDPTAADPRCV